MDHQHPYWRYAEKINGRLAMLGLVIGALKACKKYNPVLLDKTKKSNVIQITALRREIDKMSKDLKKFGLVSVSRTGAVAMTRGADIFK